MSDERDPINIRRAAQITMAGCTMILFVLVLRFFLLPGSLGIVESWSAPAPNQATIQVAYLSMVFADLLVAVAFLGITAVVVRPQIAEEAIQPLERQGERWEQLCKIRRRNRCGIWGSFAYLLTCLGLLCLHQLQTDRWILSLGAIITQGVFVLLTALFFYTQLSLAQKLAPPE